MSELAILDRFVNIRCRFDQKSVPETYEGKQPWFSSASNLFIPCRGRTMGSHHVASYAMHSRGRLWLSFRDRDIRRVFLSIIHGFTRGLLHISVAVAPDVVEAGAQSASSTRRHLTLRISPSFALNWFYQKSARHYDTITKYCKSAQCVWSRRKPLRRPERPKIMVVIFSSTIIS